HGVGVSTVCSETEAGVIASAYATPLTRQIFIANPATGDFDANSKNINDGDGVDAIEEFARATVIGQYAEVDFGGLYRIKKWRQYGHANNNEDGTWKIEYYLEAWHDWITGIFTRTAATWSTWSEETAVTASKIRLVCTEVDSCAYNFIEELQITFSE
ncbi:unnamed protein product, partial [marine sediment metagenome]